MQAPVTEPCARWAQGRDGAEWISCKFPWPDCSSTRTRQSERSWCAHHCSHCWTRHFQLWFSLFLIISDVPRVPAYFGGCWELSLNAWKGIQGPRLSMPGDVGCFKAPKLQLFKEARPGGGKAVVQVLLKPHPAVGSQVWHSKSLALFKFGLKIPMKSYSTCWVTTFHNVITWPFQRVGFRSTYYWLKACQISFFLSKLHVMIHGDPSVLFLIRCCSPVREAEGKQSDVLKKYVLSRSWGIQRNTRKAFWD